MDRLKFDRWLLSMVPSNLEPQCQTSRKFELLKSRLKSYGFEFGKVVYKEGAYILRPVRANQISTGAMGIALLGEAAGLISPSSAEGFSYALRSALVLSEALRETPDGFERRYRRKLGRLKRNIFVKNLKSHFIYDPPLRRIVMRTGIQSMKLHQS